MQRHADAICRLSTLPSHPSEEYDRWIEQVDFLEFLRANAGDNEFILYASAAHTFVHAVTVPLKALDPLDISDILQWNCTPYSSWGFSYTASEDGTFTQASICPPLDSSGSKSLSQGEQLVFPRNFEGRLETEDQKYIELSQKFAHLHDLHYAFHRRAYCRFDAHGDVDEIVNIELIDDSQLDHGGTVVTIRREVLDCHLALSDSAVIVLFDSTRFRPEAFSGWGDLSEEQVDLSQEKLFYRIGILPGHASFVRGIQVIESELPPKHAWRALSGMGTKNQYATYIAFDFKHGVVEEISCDPRCLGNYFVPSDLPFQTTPSFFRPEVLTKYKNDSQKYQLTDRSIKCRAAWSLQSYDINEAGQVHTYLIYLSRLPYSEQLYWKAYNEAPRAGLSKRAIATDFEGRWDWPPDALTRLRTTVRELSEGMAAWWKLPVPDLMDRLHYPITNATDEWANALLVLDQIVVEGLDHSYFKAKLKFMEQPIDPSWHSITMMERVLETAGLDDNKTSVVVKPLRELHHLRTKMKGHAAAKEATIIRDGLITQYGNLNNHFRNLVERCDQALRALQEMVAKGTI